MVVLVVFLVVTLVVVSVLKARSAMEPLVFKGGETAWG